MLADVLDRAGLLGVFRILDQLQFRVLAAAGLSFVLVLLFGRPVIRFLKRRRIGDTGMTDARALASHFQSKANVPTMGGLLIAGSIALSTLLLADITNFYVKLGIVVVLWLAMLGGADDWLKLTSASRGVGSRQGLHAWEKLVFQVGLGVLVGYFVYTQGDSPQIEHDLAHVLTLPFQRTYVPGTGELSAGLVFLPMGAFIVLSVLMIAAMSNAVNLTDGMDGLASGVTVAVSVGLVALAFIAGSQVLAQQLLVPFVVGSGELAVLLGAVTGACLGFLWWNSSPAEVFMGDTGSLCLGGVLAYSAIVIRQEFALLVMSGVFLLEIGSVILQVGYFKYTRRRYGEGRRLFRVAPIHHHFHKGGCPEQKVVVRFWIVSALLVVIAFAMVKAR